MRQNNNEELNSLDEKDFRPGEVDTFKHFSGRRDDSDSDLILVSAMDWTTRTGLAVGCLAPIAFRPRAR